MAYSKQTWDTTSYVNPTRMNHIEDGIYSVDTKTANDIPYSSGVSVKDKLDWVLIYQDLTFDSERKDVSAYSELFVVPKLQGYARSYPTYMLRLPSFDIATAGAEYSGSAVTNFIMYGININSSNTLKLRGTLRGWSSVTFDIYGKK